MASEEDIKRDKELTENQSSRAKYANNERNIVSETLAYTRDILNSLRKSADSLTENTDTRREIKSLATKINRIASDSVDLTSRNLFLLESEKDVEKEITRSLQAQRRLKTEGIVTGQTQKLLQKENLDLQILGDKALAKGNDALFEKYAAEQLANEKTINALSKVGEALLPLREDLELFQKAAEKAKTSLLDISNLPEVQFFEGMTKATKNIPFLSSFFDEALNKSKEIAREYKVSRESNLDALMSGIEQGGDGIDKQLLKDLGIDKAPELQGINGFMQVGSTTQFPTIGTMEGGMAADALKGKSREDISKMMPDMKLFTKSLKGAFKAVGPIIKKALGPIAILLEVIAAIGKADKEVVEIQKSFAASREEAMGIRTELAGVAAASGNINITTTKLLGTLTSISDQFGFIAKFSADTLVTATKLTEVVGISAEAAGQLAAASEATGTSLEQNYENVLGASYELQRQKGVQFDLRKILEATANITGQVRANLGTNPELIAKAVTQAKLFGAEMSDIVASSRTLLSFEDSIRNELQAELLIGRDLNLERARSAALMGDMETVAKELTEQAGNYTDFSKLNVLQQDALASAIGMQSDQLSDILFKQEIQGKTKKDLIALGKHELADRLEAQTVADKFQATMDKLRGTFADVATAFLPFFQLLGDALSIVNLILAPITDLVQLLVAIPRSIMGAEDAFSSIKFSTPEAYGIKSDAIGSDATFANDAMIPSSHQGGKTLLGPEGSIKFNKDDDIVAGTNLFGDRSLSQMPDYESVIGSSKPSSSLSGEKSLSQMPDYDSVLAETKTKINPISSIEPTSTINTETASTVNNNQTQINQESEELVNQMKAMNAAINKQTEILAKGQNTIAQTKTKLQVGATDLGTQLNVNSFRIQ